MFADPQSLTINAVANSFAAVSRGDNKSVYQTADGNRKLTISSTPGNRNRRMVRLDDRKVAADPLATGYNKEYSMATYLVIDSPQVGYSIAEIKIIIDALTLFLTTGSGANVTKVLGGES